MLERKYRATHGIADRIEVGDCWQWTGYRDKDGYGHFGSPARLAHRLVWEALVGPIPEGLHLDHLCRNTGCVNPDHLEPVTAAENNRRVPEAIRGNRVNHAKGPDHPNSKKTHCKWGHPLTPENTFVNEKGWRYCLPCRQIRHSGTHAKGPTCNLYCKAGHPLFGPDADWIPTNKGISRRCGICQRAYMAEYHRRRKQTDHPV